MKESKSPGDGEQTSQQELEEFLEEWRQTLPKEFTLGTVGNGQTTHRKFPDLHFTADDSIPGLYYADLDPEILAFNSNGNSDSIDFSEDDQNKDG